MGKITKIESQRGNPNKVNVFIDDEFCTGAERRIVESLGIEIGKEIECEELKELINFFWKKRYRYKWKEEKERIKKVIKNIHTKLPELKFEIFGFGADTDEMIKKHPLEKGIPDVLIIYEKNNFNYVLTFLEVTGTKQIRETDDIWIRPDKFEFAKNHPYLDIFIAHYVDDKNLLRFISTKDTNNLPEPKEIIIRGNKEIYVMLSFDHESVISSDQFIDYLKGKIDNIR